MMSPSCLSVCGASPETFREALSFSALLHYALWLEGDYQTRGRLTNT